MSELEGTGEGIQTGAGTGPEIPAWIAQLPDTLKGNEAFTTYKTIGDLGKSHLELMGKVKELDGLSAQNMELQEKMAGYIPKLSEKPTTEELTAYRKAMGVPDKPTEYEFVKGDGIEHDPKMIEWAQSVFHEAGLNKSQASLLGQKWDTFISEMAKAEEKMDEDTKTENEKKFREQFKTEEEYKAGKELAKRLWNKVTNTDFDAVYQEAETWQVPLFMNFIFNIAKVIGEDLSPEGKGSGTGEVRPQMNYSQSDMEKFAGT